MVGRSALEQNFESPEFQKAFERYYKNMKLMSIATGKTVENLVEEQKLKDNTRVGQTFKMTHTSQSKALGSLGLSEELNAYIISGGVKNVKEATLAMANSPIMKELLPALLAKGATNLDQDYVTGLKERVSGLAAAERNRLTSNVQNLGMATAGYMSDDFARMNFDTYGLQLAETGKNVSNAREIMEDKNNKQSKAIKSQSDINRAKNRAETEKTYMESGGTDNWIKSTNIATEAINVLVDTLHTTNDILKKYPLLQFAGSVAASSVGYWGPGLLDKSVKTASNTASKATSSMNSKWASLKNKKYGSTVGKLAKGANIIGAGLEIYGAYDKISDASALKERGVISDNEYKDTRNMAIGNAVGGIGGAGLGTYIGGAIGAIGGPIGVAIGASIGGALGNVVGSWVGEKVGDSFVSDKTYMEEIKTEEKQIRETSLTLQKEQIELAKESNALLVEMVGTEKSNAIINRMKTNSYTNNQTNYI